MWNCILFLGFISLMGIKEGSGVMDQKTWTYEIKSIESKSSNPDLLYFDLKNERISRGVFALSGEFFLNFDIQDGDGNELGAKSYRSANGDGDYKALPFQLASSHWFKFLNTNYKDTVMETLKDCSDAPYFTDKFEGPFEKKKYTLTKCQFSQDGYPNHMQEGTYKVVIFGTGTVDWEIVLIVDIEAKV